MLVVHTSTAVRCLCPFAPRLGALGTPLAQLSLCLHLRRGSTAAIPSSGERTVQRRDQPGAQRDPRLDSSFIFNGALGLI